MSDNRNMILAVVLSLAILIGFQFFMEQQMPPPAPPQATTEATPGATTGTPAPGPAIPGTSGQQPPVPVPVPTPAPAAPGTTTGAAPGAPIPGIGAAAPSAAETRAAVLAVSPRVTIDSPRLHGSISLTGARLDDITLADYRETLDPESTEIVLLTPRGTEDAYFAEYGWYSPMQVPVPGPDTVWTADGDTLTSDKPVTLSWDNGAGLRFERTYALDKDYMFTVTQRVTNTTGAAATLHPWARLSRRGTPDVTGFVILHEGLLGVFDGTLKEVDYDEIKEGFQEKGPEGGRIQQDTTGGWIGITDKYWLAALIPDQKTKVRTDFIYFKHKQDESDRYQVDFMEDGRAVAAGGSVEVTSRLFTGAKEVAKLDGYETDLGVARFDLAIDFGWFYFLTKPIFYTLIYMNDYVGNFGVSILLLTVLIKLLFFPLANKSYVSMAKMKKLQPEMMKLREQFSNDKQKLNQEIMALYKREKANPASGCLPMIIQIPVFFALYKVLFVSIEMRQAPFFGWIHDLSVPDPTTILNLFGLIPWEPADYLPEYLMMLNIGVWPLIMGVSMFLQQKLNPQPADPVQAKVFMFLPLFFTFLLAQFPAGLVIYWAWNNALSILQQRVIMKRVGV